MKRQIFQSNVALIEKFESNHLYFKATKYSTLPDAFVPVAVRVCKLHARRVSTGVESNQNMFENERKLLEDHFKLDQSSKFRNRVLNRKSHFKIVIVCLIDAVFRCRCILQAQWISKICCSWFLNNWSFKNSFFPVQMEPTLCSSVMDPSKNDIQITVPHRLNPPLQF